MPKVTPPPSLRSRDGDATSPTRQGWGLLGPIWWGRQLAWVDSFKRSRSWQIIEDSGAGDDYYPPHTDYTNGIIVPVHASGDGLGYPDFQDTVISGTTDRAVMSMVYQGMADTLMLGTGAWCQWHLKWDGDGDVILIGGGLHSDTVNSNDITYKMHGSQNNTQMRVIITRSEASSPVRNIRILCPDLQTDATGQTAYVEDSVTPVFRPEFIDAIIACTPTGTRPIVRVMDWCNVNGCGKAAFNYRVWDCSDHTQILTRSSVRQMEDINMQRRGVAPAHMADLVNEMGDQHGSGCDIWVCLPHKENCTDDQYESYIEQWCTLFRAEMDATNRVIFEYSNEVWNPGTGAFDHIVDVAGTGMTDANDEFQEAVADEIFECFGHAKSIFSGSTHEPKARYVVMGRRSRSAFLQGVLMHLETDNPGYVNDLEAAGCAGYVKPYTTAGWDSANTMPTEVVYQLEQGLELVTKAHLRAHFLVVKGAYDDLEFWLYEAGQHVVAEGGGAGEWWGAAGRAQLIYDMYVFYRNLMTAMSDPDIQVDNVLWYLYCMAPGMDGFWGHIYHHDTVAETTNPGYGVSPKLDAIEEGF